MTVFAGFIQNLQIKGISLVGIGDANPNQDGLAIVSVPRALDNVGGVDHFEWDNLVVSGFNGQQTWMRGGQRTNGIFSGLLPLQFGMLRDCTMNYSPGRHAFEAIGQFGQVLFKGGLFEGVATTTGGCNIVISRDYRYFSPTPAYADPGTGLMACSANWDWPHSTPCRLIGTAPPSALSKGVTYWAWQGNVGGNSPSIGAFYIASSVANAGTETPVLLGSTGTYGSYQFVPLWATALSSNTFTTSLPHKLITGDKLRVVGTRFPSALSTGVDYYAIRVDHLRWKLASSEANAIAGTAIVMTGGVFPDFGFVANDGTEQNLRGPYTVGFDKTTLQIRRLGIFVSGGLDISGSLHIEQLTRTFHFVSSIANVSSGEFLSAANNGGAGVWLTAAGADCKIGLTGKPAFRNAPDQLYAVFSGATVDTDATQPAISVGTWPTLQSTGRTLQVSAAITIDIGAATDVQVPTSATAIATITSAHTVGARFTLTAIGGSIVLAGSGNVRMTGSPLTIPQNGSVELKMVDTIGPWLMVGKSF